MKTIWLSFIFMIILFPALTATAQEKDPGEKKLTRSERKALQARQTDDLIQSRNYVFRPRQALPTGWKNVQLDFSFSLWINKDTLVSYMPFYGVAYRAEYGSRQSPFDFTRPLENYRMEKNKKGYQISFEAKNDMDYLTYALQVSESGHASLIITSVNRQTISYYGTIEAPDSWGEKTSGKTNNKD